MPANTLIPTDTAISYPVMEHFYTLQGEGFFSGQAAYFIRLGGCDVGCVWCDVKESWDADTHPKLTITEIVKAAKEFPARIAVITGGEPAMHDLVPLTKALHQEGFRTHIETSGTHLLSGDFDFVTFSPKKFKSALPDFSQLANELKVVVFHKSDFAFAEQYASGIPENSYLFLQPEWSKKDEMTPLIIDYIQQNPKWRLSLQTHKYIGIP